MVILLGTIVPYLVKACALGTHRFLETIYIDQKSIQFDKVIIFEHWKNLLQVRIQAHF